MDVKKLTYRLIQVHAHPNKKENKLGERKERGIKLGEKKKRNFLSRHMPGRTWLHLGDLCLVAAKETINVIATMTFVKPQHSVLVRTTATVLLGQKSKHTW